ncbi:COP9 signalosome complex subunit 7b, partial [Coemansia sp. RSA 1290]
LNAQQLNKLKLLTLVTLASNDKVLDYDQVISELDCSSEKEMEDLVIDAIYKNLISAKLDQKKRIVEVDFVVGRDVRSEDLQDIYNKLEAWSKTCEDALAGIGNDIEASNAAALAKREDNREFTKTLEELRASQQEPGGLPRTDSQYESTEYQREAERVKSNVP